MAFVNDAVRDAALDYLIGEAATLHICSAEPASYAGIAAVALGSKSGLTLTGPTDGATDGRAATVPAITDGSVTGTGTATHWALSDGTAALLASGALSASQAVTSGNTFTLGAFAVTIRDPA